MTGHSAIYLNGVFEGDEHMAYQQNIGDKMPDGTVFADISPDNEKPMYARPADASLTMTFNEARAENKVREIESAADAICAGTERPITVSRPLKLRSTR
jgi:hypothetical protein